LGAILSGVSPLYGSDELVVQSYVDRTRIPVNQQFNLSVEYSGKEANKASTPQPPNLEPFATYLGSSSSQSIQIINAQMSVTRTFTFTYLAKQVGTYQIPAIKVAHKGKTYSTAPITIQIVQAAQPQPPRAQRRRPGAQITPESTLEGNLFIKAIPNKRRVYQNEPVIVTYKIYTRVEVSQYGITQMPRAVGFWMEDLEIALAGQAPQPQTQVEVIDGKRFVTAEIKKLALFPTDAGKKVIDPLVVECEVRLRERRPRDFFDRFFDDDFFSDFFGRRIRTVVKSEPLSIEVLPLPEAGRPKDFTGAVGQFRITATVDKQNVKTNEAITFKVKISGQGNIKMLPEPKISIPPDFERYEPKITETINRKGNRITGSKTFEYVLVPRYPGLQKIKPVRYSYFDPAAGRYKVIETPEIAINVAKGEEAFVTFGSGLSKEEVKLIGQDIRFIKLEMPEFRRKDWYLYRSPLFLLLLVVPLLAAVGAWGYRKRLDRLAENVAYARSLKANQMAMKRLKTAHKLMKEETQKEFYAEVSRALLGFIGDKFNLPPAGLMTDQVRELLSSQGVSEEVISRYVGCLQTCDYQRFAPARSRLEEMKAFFKEAKDAIVELERAI